jgi:uncharacterized protein YndB with AHSA1/START domain
VLILGGGAVLLVSFLLVGYLLPNDWDAEASRHVAAPPEVVFELLDSPEGWQRWTPWPESGVARSGPQSGTGATLSWDDPEVGSGSFTIGEVAELTRVAYTVVIDEGAMHAEGSVQVAPEEGGSRVTWRERGDLGWNPLMGYWALSMSRAQADELLKGLDRLEAAAAAPPSPTEPIAADPVR